MVTGQVKLVSVSAGGQEAGTTVQDTSISGDGRYVVFRSLMGWPPVGPSDLIMHVWRKDLSTGTLSLCSVNASGARSNGNCLYPHLSSNGRYVAFSSLATNLLSPPSSGLSLVYRKDMSTGALALASATASGVAADGQCWSCGISADGRYVVMDSFSKNMCGFSTNMFRIYRKDVSTGAVLLCSSNASGEPANEASTSAQSISADGRYVAFHTTSTNLGYDMEPGLGQNFRKDLSSGAIALCTSNASNIRANDRVYDPWISADGRFVAFKSAATNLVSTKTSGIQVFRKEVLGPTPVWYLAEGTENWGFEETIAIENPNATDVTVRITYMTESGSVVAPNQVVKKESIDFVRPYYDVGHVDFSTKVECLEGKSIAVSREMMWGLSGPKMEAHESIGVTAPARVWFLPEGSSAWGFECWLLIQNPNSSKATCQVTYMIEGLGPKTVSHEVPASSRKTFNMKDDIGEHDASIKVLSDIPVIPERAMYKNNRAEGHDSIGTTTPNEDYYLAEGTTAWGFTTYVLVQNPNDTAVDVTVTYMTTGGPKQQPSFRMPANSRKTIRVNDVMPDTDFSTKVHGTKPIIAERAMYWNSSKGESCHDSIGMAAPHTTFYLPYGGNAYGGETWTLVQNLNDTPVKVEVKYILGQPLPPVTTVFTDTIPASSRRTYRMQDKAPNHIAGVQVKCLTSGKKIMVEGANYFMNKEGGSESIGGYSD